MHLESEIADVSFDGMVVFEDVRFSNVSLARGAIASTTLNDYQQAIGVYIRTACSPELANQTMQHLQQVMSVSSPVFCDHAASF